MSTVTDFSQYTALRADAVHGDGARSGKALREVATQFEALFVQQMLKSMRDASFGDPLFPDTGANKMYRDLFDQQIATDLAQGPGIGLADMLVRQLGGEPSSARAATPSGLPGVLPVGPQVALKGAVAAAPVPTATATTEADRPTWQTPGEFVAEILPHARRAAAKLGVHPLGIVAQAALETGWGQSLGARESFNLFGIKAGGDWRGASDTRSTLEFEDGAMQKKSAAFRAYDTIGAAFDDYVEFIGQAKRYDSVRRTGADLSRFAQALQDAGFATDPAYAAKIKRVVGSDTMRGALEALKSRVTTSLTPNGRHGVE
ncbi:MAG: flagellar assembly peptidoglycan hydrolase FlgJ [Pseudomonadota bacterium]